MLRVIYVHEFELLKNAIHLVTYRLRFMSYDHLVVTNTANSTPLFRG
jgi:hypothetical protein